jgi:BirA family transcriptional regulator, biotin operon repressor / biotin---[acetyl-CoA-carboxylase] ligase
LTPASRASLKSPQVDNDMWDFAALEEALVGTAFAGKLHFALVTGSTNNDATAAARQGAPHGSVFIADEQTAGRGRGDHRWDSPAGEGLFVTVLLRPQVPAARLPLLPLAAGLAAVEGIRAASGLTADLRWPNDLLIADRKAGGILVEAGNGSRTRDSGGLAHAVVGIGINVHQRGFPAGLDTPATSLDLETGHRVSRQALLAALLKSLECEALRLADPAAPPAIFARVEQASSWVRGRGVVVHGPQACEGITAGLDDHGFLLVNTAAGLMTVQSGGLRAKD